MSDISFDKPTFDRLVIEHKYAVEKGHTSFMFDGQELYAQKLIDKNTAVERLELFSFLKSAYPEVAKKYFNISSDRSHS